MIEPARRQNEASNQPIQATQNAEEHALLKQFFAGSDVVAGSISPANAPLEGMTPWWVFQRCVWLSDEDTNIKATLLCVSRFMDRTLHGSSMSYTQIARDCGFNERTAKRCVQAVNNIWLKIEVGRGRYTPGKGHENLYHGIIPQKWLDALRCSTWAGSLPMPPPSSMRATTAVPSTISQPAGS